MSQKQSLTPDPEPSRPLTDDQIWGESFDPAEFIADCPRRDADGRCPDGCDACGQFLAEMDLPLQQTTETTEDAEPGEAICPFEDDDGICPIGCDYCDDDNEDKPPKGGENDD